MLKRLVQRPGAQALGARAAARYLWLALGATRWTVDGEHHLPPFIAGQPAIFAFWHECLPLMPAFWMWFQRQQRQAGLATPMHVLVSRHKDGRFIGEVMRSFGVALVHGSSRRGDRDRGGSQAARTLVEALQQGGVAGITPDGPRGPRRHAARGVAQLAARAGVPVVPLAAQTRHRRVLSTWDRMVLPLPGGRGALVCGAPVLIGPDGGDAALPAIERALTAAADRADALCC